MPAVVIGPTVALIRLSLSSQSVSSLRTANAGGIRWSRCSAAMALGVTMAFATYGKEWASSYLYIRHSGGLYFSAVLTFISKAAGIDALLISTSALTQNFENITLELHHAGVDHLCL